jgi:hypothetical protein
MRTGEIMQTSITSTQGEALSRVQSAAQNISTSTAKLKVGILWLIVGLPLLWGVMKALEDIGNLPF